VEGRRLGARARLTAASRWAGRGEAATSCTMESSPRALATVAARGGDGGDALREVKHAERELRGVSSASWGGDAGAGKSASASAGVNGKWHAHVPRLRRTRTPCEDSRPQAEVLSARPDPALRQADLAAVRKRLELKNKLGRGRINAPCPICLCARN